MTQDIPSSGSDINRIIEKIESIRLDQARDQSQLDDLERKMIARLEDRIHAIRNNSSDTEISKQLVVVLEKLSRLSESAKDSMNNISDIGARLQRVQLENNQLSTRFDRDLMSKIDAILREKRSKSDQIRDYFIALFIGIIGALIGVLVGIMLPV